jgi:hypothetical protein
MERLTRAGRGGRFRRRGGGLRLLFDIVPKEHFNVFEDIAEVLGDLVVHIPVAHNKVAVTAFIAEVKV